LLNFTDIERVHPELAVAAAGARKEIDKVMADIWDEIKQRGPKLWQLVMHVRELRQTPEDEPNQT
jgi:hypothetical protein